MRNVVWYALSLKAERENMLCYCRLTYESQSRHHGVVLPSWAQDQGQVPWEVCIGVVSSGVVILFMMLWVWDHFPTCDDLHKTNLNLWSEPGLSKCEMFIMRKEVQSSYNCSSRSDLTADVKASGHNHMSLPSFCTEHCHLIYSVLQQKPKQRLGLGKILHHSRFQVLSLKSARFYRFVFCC